ncbi:MAG: hypothetical protein H6810_07955 [Phycisphaeraceae bacterium]|nr:MAG: hypothetical protein H6810_07955 [Phycisphaeraceae bacterium]
MRRSTVSRARPAFTLLETVLASIIGSMVLAAALSLFVAMSRAEQFMGKASEQIEDLALTQQVFRKSFMTMVLASQDSYARQMSNFQADGELTEDELVQLPRPRILLEFDTSPSIAAMRSNAEVDGVHLDDPADFGLGPQRLEITLPDKPVPESMRLFPAAWSTAPSDDLVQSFDPSGVERPATEAGMRGCFELRPDGARERLMEGYGLVPATGPEPPPQIPAARKPPDGWTLWWRPMYGAECQARQQGLQFDIDLQPVLLAEAVPLIRGIGKMRWFAFAAEEDPDNPDAPAEPQRWPAFEGTTTADIPGYMEVEIDTTSGTYVSWAFELGWSLAEEYAVDQPDDTNGDGTDDGQQNQSDQQNQSSQLGGGQS